MAAGGWSFEEFEPGLIVELGTIEVSADEIVAFALEFDPQPMHLDEAAGRESLLGGLAASGWHVCALFMRLFHDGLLAGSTAQGAPGIDYVRWKRPVLAGDRLSGRTMVLETRASRSRPGLGFVLMESQLANQRGEIAFEQKNSVMFLTRDPSRLA